MKKMFIIVLTLVVLTGCNDTKKENKKENVSNVDTCPNCVYGYYENSVKIGDILSNYTKDYTTLKYDDNTQRKEFFGYVLDSENKIINGYVCGIVNNKVLCLEGNDSSKYEYNKELLKNNFSVSVCADKKDEYGPYYECNSDDIYMVASSDGYVYIASEKECDVDKGIMSCV